MRHTTIDTVDLATPLVDADFAREAQTLAAEHTDETYRYLFLMGEVETGKHPSLDALVVDIETARLERMTIEEPASFSEIGLRLDTHPLDLVAVRRMFERAGRAAEFEVLRPRLNESLPDDIAADGDLLAETLALVEAAIERATTDAGIVALRKAASPLRI